MDKEFVQNYLEEVEEYTQLTPIFNKTGTDTFVNQEEYIMIWT